MRTLARNVWPAVLLVALPGTLAAQRSAAYGAIPRASASDLAQPAVLCDLEPGFAALAEDSAAFVNAPLADARATLDALRHCASERRRDGAAWFRTGYLAHLYGSREDRDPALNDRSALIRLRREAADAMRLGVEYAPDSARFRLASLSVLRVGVVASRPRPLSALPPQLFDEPEAIAEATGDSVVLSRIAIERARWYANAYRSRTNLARVAKPLQTLSEPVQEGRLSPFVWRFLEHRVEPVTAPQAADELRLLLAASERAVTLDPTHDLAWDFRYRALLLADDLPALRDAARTESAVDPSRAMPWLVAGFAAHRLGDDIDAMAAFDSALVRMDAAERDLWMAPLHPGAAALSFTAMPPAAMLRTASLFDAFASFVALHPANPDRSEYLARRVEAELRFGDPEREVRGVETEFGATLARFGPPDRIAVLPPINPYGTTFKGCSFFTEPDAQFVGGLGTRGLPRQIVAPPCFWPADARSVTVLWGYDDLQEGIVFRESPGAAVSSRIGARN